MPLRATLTPLRLTPRCCLSSPQSIELFFELSDEDIFDVAKACSVHFVPAGELVVAEGRPGAAFFVIHSGRAAVHKAASAGALRLALQRPSAPLDRSTTEAFGPHVLTLAPGDFFGHQATVFRRVATNPFTVCAARFSGLMHPALPALRAILTPHPSLSRALPPRPGR